MNINGHYNQSHIELCVTVLDTNMVAFAGKDDIIPHMTQIMSSSVRFQIAYIILS